MTDTANISPRPASGTAEFLAGLRDILPLVITVIPFALLLGSLAAQKNLSPAETGLMSFTVFAGGSQFVAVELWQSPTPVATLITATFLVNLRHVLMGASLVPHLRDVSQKQAYAVLFLLADECWAMAMRRAAKVRLTIFYLLGLGLVMWVNWVAWTTTGAILGHALEDPAAYGFDFVFTAVFLALLVGFWAGPRSAVPWVVSALVAVTTYHSLPGVWYIVFGGLAGALTGAIQGHKPEQVGGES